jgi:drug/metabolite transporter (DMT)-like permease
LLAEPVLSPLWAWLVHRETPGPMALVGAAVILGATAAKTWQDSRLGGASVTAGERARGEA